MYYGYKCIAENHVDCTIPKGVYFTSNINVAMSFAQSSAII